ncbi:MAG: UDP-N-acetylmuramate--L-alanine ligase [Parcubacteria group bacterium]
MGNINLGEVKKIYVIGIKGSGVIAVVEILHAMGMEITGSDTSEKFFTDEILQRLGINYHEKFDAGNVPADADLVLYITCYNAENNVEMAEVQKRDLPMVSYPEMVAHFFNEKYGIAVAGTHGKTTTSALLANTLKECGVDPNAIIGSKVLNWGGNALIGQGEFFVLEADEYQNKLRLYAPKAVILTSCDFDHPDFFADFAEYKKAFQDFVVRIPKVGFLVVWGDSTDTLEIAESCKAEVLTYGFGENNDYRISNLEFRISNEFQNSNDQIPKQIQAFEVFYGDSSLGVFEIQLSGRHNVLNAAAVIATCNRLQIDLEKVRLALGNFQGTARRFEYIGERNGALLIDDYGHHPEEIRATLAGARSRYPEKNIWAVFHPHTFTRTKALLSEFSQSFDAADKVIVLDIYGSARETQGGVHSKDLVKLIDQFGRGKAEYVPTISEAVEYLKDKIGPDDVVITIGAGNGWEVAEKLSRPLIRT